MRAPKIHAEWSGVHAEISHMRTIIQGQKLKLEIDCFPDPSKIEQMSIFLKHPRRCWEYNVLAFRF